MKVNNTLVKAYAQGVVYSGIYKFSTLPKEYEELAKKHAASYSEQIIDMALVHNRITKEEYNCIMDYK